MGRKLTRAQKAKIEMGFAAALGCLLLMGCGSQKIDSSISGTSSEASVSDSTPVKTTARCSMDNKGLSDLGISAMTFADDSSSDASRIRLRVLKSPTSFQAIRFTAANFDTAGKLIEQPFIKFYVERKGSGTFVPVSPTYQELTWDMMKQLGTALKVTVSTPDDFFTNFTFVGLLPDSSDKWAVLTVGLYNSAGDTAPRGLSTLIPSYLANPTDYKAAKPAAIYKFHPFYEKLTLADADYATNAERYCF